MNVYAVLFATVLTSCFSMTTLGQTRDTGPIASPPAVRRPLSFDANQGQADPHARFVARAAGMDVFLTAQGALLALTEPSRTADDDGRRQALAVRLRFAHANPNPRLEGVDALPGRAHHLLGNDPRRWRKDIPQYRRVRYRNVYPGVDVVYYGSDDGKLEFDVELAPGADLAAVRLRVDGADGLTLDADGHLHLRTPLGDLIQHRPVVYQTIAGRRHELRGSYALHDVGRDSLAHEIGFKVDGYDPRVALVLDPTLVAAFLVGGTSADLGTAVASDADGNWYFAGYTSSTGVGSFPTTVGAYQTANQGGNDVFVRKVSNDGATVLYSTLIGGGGSDVVNAIAVDAAGNAVIVGQTASSNYPTQNALQPNKPGHASATVGFVTSLNAAGSGLNYSTYLGGGTLSFETTYARDVAVDELGSAYVTGETVVTDLPTSATAFQSTSQGQYSAFVFKFDAAGARQFGTYIVDDDSGFGGDRGTRIAIDDRHNVYVGGYTNSFFPGDYNGVPTKRLGPGGSNDVLVARLNHTGAWLDWVTHVGGSALDHGFGLAVDRRGHDLMLAARSLSTDLAPDSPRTDNWIWLGHLDASGTQLLDSVWLGAAGTQTFPTDLLWNDKVLVVGDAQNPSGIAALDPIAGLDCGASCGTATTYGGVICSYAPAPLAAESCTRVVSTGGMAGNNTRFNGVAQTLDASPGGKALEEIKMPTTSANTAVACKSDGQVAGAPRPDPTGENMVELMLHYVGKQPPLPLEIDKIFEPPEAEVGEEVVLRLRFHNPNGFVVNGPSIKDVLPTCLTFKTFLPNRCFEGMFWERYGAPREFSAGLVSFLPGQTCEAKLIVTAAQLGVCNNTVTVQTDNEIKPPPASAWLSVTPSASEAVTTGTCDTMTMLDTPCWANGTLPDNDAFAEILAHPGPGPISLNYNQPASEKIDMLRILGPTTVFNGPVYLGSGLDVPNSVSVTIQAPVRSVADTLAIDVGSTGGIVDFENEVFLDEATLIKTGSGTVTFDGVAAGEGGMVFLDDGTVEFHATPSFDGDIDCSGGTVDADVPIAQPFHAYGTCDLISDGPLGQVDLTNLGEWHTTAATIGTVSVSELNVAESGRVTLASAPGNLNLDVVNVSGLANLAGGVIAVDFNGPVPPGLVIGDVITAPGGGITGCFDSAVSDDPNVALTVTCTSVAVSLQVAATHIFYSGFE